MGQKRSTIAPAITRVHKLFRIRTVVNDSSKYLSDVKAGINTNEVGEILVNRRLSKSSILESPNKLKRARDHALNASILGFFIPIRQDHQFLYVKSRTGYLLEKYEFSQECPNDLHESSIFIDRMMRLKLTNPYDSRRTYSRFHVRPFLSLLTILKHLNLHISQIHYLLSQTNDLASNPAAARKLLGILSKYPSYDDKSITQFNKNFKLEDKKTQKEMMRSTKPLLDWGQQGGLLTLGKDYWCTITEKGLEAQKYYAQYFPMWQDWLPFNSPLASALLIIYINALNKGIRINRNKFGSESREILDILQSKYNLWQSSFSHLIRPIDFDLNYDVSYGLRDDVYLYLNQLSEDQKLKAPDPDELSILTISQIEGVLSKTSTERDQSQLSNALGIHIPRRECFQTALEWQICTRLRVLRFSAYPYQGEFEGETDLPMAKDNPDIIMKNSINILVECKSRNEWGDLVKYDKRVGGEIYMYQNYAEDVNADSVVFICDVDGFDKKKFIEQFIKQGQKLSKVCMVTWSYLDRIQNDNEVYQHFKETIFNPESKDSDERILCYS